MKQTEDEIIEDLQAYLEKNGWTINGTCLGQKHGIDIDACNASQRLIIEAKGAKAGDHSPTKKREYFDSGQIKTHFGKAIVKLLDEKHLYPDAMLAIAHPDDFDIRKSIGHLVPFLRSLGIGHYWVSRDGTVVEE